jgi:DNA gyrase/topoisomerase IV subunit A
MISEKSIKNSSEKTVTEYLYDEYAAYGMYTIENRAIPSVIDGFKPTQRKIIYVANKVWKSGSEKPVKVFQLGGRIAADAHYHHGDASLNSAIIGMAQSFKNSLPLLDEIGQFGSLRSPEAGAPRYISTKINGNFRLIYKDFELLERQFEEGQEIEPKFFLPIIPTVLLNGSSGIAVGFATNILNRNPLDLIDACLKALEGKKFNEPLPWWRDFNGTVQKVDGQESSFQLNGTYTTKDTTTVQISELPPSMTYLKYENYLNSLIEGGYIQNYDDNCTKNIDYTIKFSRAQLQECIKKDNLIAYLKLGEKESENLTCLDENGKLIIFNNVIELINYFVKFRLSFYDKRKDYLLSELANQHQYLSNRARFIKMIIDGKLKVNNRPKQEIVNDLEKSKFDKINSSYDYLLSMAIHSLTKERYEELLKQVSENEVETKRIEAIKPIDMYKSDLKELKKKLETSK